MRYELVLTRRESRAFNGIGLSARDAVKRIYAGAAAAGFRVESVRKTGESVAEFVAGICEACEDVILEGDDYAADEEGTRFCAACCQASESA